MVQSRDNCPISWSMLFCLRRKCPPIVVLWFIFCGLLMIIFARTWLLSMAMRNESAPARRPTHVRDATSLHRETSSTIFHEVVAAASSLLNPRNEANSTSDADAEKGSSSSRSHPTQRSSIIRGQSGFNCKAIRNGTKPAAAVEGEKYVTLSPSNVDSRRLGNQLFNLAAILMVAKVTKRKPFFPAGWLENAFDLRVDRLAGSRAGNRICPCYTFKERHSMYFDERLPDLGETDPPAKGLLLSGYFQSWRYLEYVEDELRCRLRFRDRVRAAAELFLDEHRTTEWEIGTYTRIGVHVRRTDFLQPDKQQHGYTTPTMTYFRSAIDYFRKRHWRLHLVVTSDDLTWTKEHFAEFRTSNVSVTFSEDNTGPVDLAILSACHSLVLSTGTFGWWAAWLANVPTVYFKDWPQPGSTLDSYFNRQDFFPPQWIAA